MPHSLQRKMGLAVLGGLFVLSAIWVISQRSVARLAHTAEAVERTHAATHMLEQSYSQLTAAESNARGFFLTGDSSYLAAYEAARRAAATHLTALRGVTDAEARERGRVARLERLAARRFVLLDSGIRVRQDSGPSAIAARARAGAGRAVMDTIHLEMNALRAVRDAEIARHTAAESSNIARVVQLMALGFLLAPALSGLAALAIRRDMGERARAARALEEAKEQAEEAQAHAEQASRAKSDFLARMSHELRTPLNSIIGFSNVLLKNRGAALQQKDLVYLQRIIANGKQLLALINDILDLSKVEAGRVQIEHAPVALDELITDLVAGFEGQLQEREGVTLDVELPAGMAPIISDAGKLQQVLINLIGNAVKFTPQGQVTVRVVTEPESGVPQRVEVWDTGVGIPPDRRDVIFEAFEQAHPGVARQYGGTGLGLAIARSLCTAMGYGLEVRGNPAGGSVFVVLLTEDSEHEAAARRAGGPRTPISLYRVTR